MLRTLARPGVLAVTLAGAGILMITMGSRQSLGLFVSPINTSTGMGIASISFALAVGQFCWGAIQPFAGALADRFGPRLVLIGGLLILALGCALTPFVHDGFGLTVALGILAAIGSGAGSFSTLFGAAARRLPLESLGWSGGVINAGGSFGQFVFAPVLQKLIQSIGWMGAMFSMAVVSLAAIPLVGKITGQEAAEHTQTAASGGGIGQAVRVALREPSYWMLHAGFFTCGFHVAFLVTHLPGEVNLCGLPANVASWSLAIIGLANIVGSLYAGFAVTKYRSKLVLAAMYGSRALLIIWYLMMPRTPLVYYIFAAGLGFTWIATASPTATLIGKLFGSRYFATLFGLTLMTHQIGGFLGAWLGGVAITHFGDFTWMWYADIALAAAAAFINLPIREAPMLRTQTSPA